MDANTRPHRLHWSGVTGRWGTESPTVQDGPQYRASSVALEWGDWEMRNRVPHCAGWTPIPGLIGCTGVGWLGDEELLSHASTVVRWLACIHVWCDQLLISSCGCILGRYAGMTTCSACYSYRGHSTWQGTSQIVDWVLRKCIIPLECLFIPLGRQIIG